MLIESYYNDKILQIGINGLTNMELNEFCLDLADKNGILVYEVTKEYLHEYHKQLKIKYFSDVCEQTIVEGFVSTTNGNQYRLNRDDQLNLLGKYTFVKEDTDVTVVYWKAENLGMQIPHTKEEFLSIVKEGFEHKEKTLYKLDQLRKRVRECLTDSEILAVYWDQPETVEEPAA
ncbi:hypothetical protein [Cytobacillus oceanisediminis]|uniref:DUF4376 domain-containing protein n=1 Tax=Cytobacillus oceanisediminis TaxID=665099 RepID=UPI001FB335CF|nr:hypothetical protein [Cytobacillus oceanisediminis]UOE58057.1 hypothetical protein IRB79_27730 [Cytobacillus oceanisediminis]